MITSLRFFRMQQWNGKVLGNGMNLGCCKVLPGPVLFPRGHLGGWAEHFGPRSRRKGGGRNEATADAGWGFYADIFPLSGYLKSMTE